MPPGKGQSKARWIAFELPDSVDLLVPGIHGNGDHLEKKLLDRPVVPLFRKSFRIDRNPVRATLSISGLGHYIASVNGNPQAIPFWRRVGTDYDKTVLYNSYDVTGQVRSGRMCSA